MFSILACEYLLSRLLPMTFGPDAHRLVVNTFPFSGTMFNPTLGRTHLPRPDQMGHPIASTIDL